MSQPKAKTKPPTIAQLLRDVEEACDEWSAWRGSLAGARLDDNGAPTDTDTEADELDEFDATVGAARSRLRAAIKELQSRRRAK